MGQELIQCRALCAGIQRCRTKPPLFRNLRKDRPANAKFLFSHIPLQGILSLGNRPRPRLHEAQGGGAYLQRPGGLVVSSDHTAAGGSYSSSEFITESRACLHRPAYWAICRGGGLLMATMAAPALVLLSHYYLWKTTTAPLNDRCQEKNTAPGPAVAVGGAGRRGGGV